MHRESTAAGLLVPARPSPEMDVREARGRRGRTPPFRTYYLLHDCVAHWASGAGGGRGDELVYVSLSALLECVRAKLANLL